jgi:hypothetical protein
VLKEDGLRQPLILCGRLCSAIRRNECRRVVNERFYEKVIKVGASGYLVGEGARSRPNLPCPCMPVSCHLRR